MDLENNTPVVDEVSSVEETPVETVSEETQEVATPEQVVESEETQEVAAPVKSDADTAFAQMRREKQDLEKTNKQLQEALGLYFEGETPDDLYIKAQANYQQKTPEEVRQEYEAQREAEQKELQFQNMAQELQSYKVKNIMSESLQQIQAIDPNVTSLEEIGGNFANYIKAGLGATEAYYAVQAQKIKETPVPPKPVGNINTGEVEQDFYTSEEVDNMTKAEVKKNLDKIKKSMTKW